MKTIKSKLSVITSVAVLLLLGAAITFIPQPAISQPSNTTIAISWDVPGVVSAQTVAAGFMQSVNSQTVQLNQAALDVFSGGCRDWTQNAVQYRALGMPQRPKPAQPPMTHFAPVILNATNPIRIQVTTTVGPDLLGTPCPDLPPLPTVVPNNFVLGAPLGGNWFAAGSGDTIPAGNIVTANDGSRYQKYGAPVGNGWYLRL